MDYRLAMFSETDPWAATSYCAIHGADPELNIGDITKADPDQCPDFDWMFGSSPCQDFSRAFTKKGSAWKCRACGHTYNPLEQHWSRREFCPECGSADLEKTRSSLIVDYLRFLRAKQPKVAMYENVANLLAKQFKPTFDLFISEVRDCGYNAYWDVLDALDYGIPQNRRRVVCVFIRKDLDNGLFTMPPPDRFRRV